MKLISTWICVLFILAAIARPAQGAVLYVDLNATNGANTGIIWTNAFTNLAYALSQAGDGTDLWVAAGTNYPGTARSDSFQMKSGVNLYGGFTNGMTSTNERNWTNNETILSGEIQQDGLQTNNVYHVVIGTNNAAIDGFTLTQAYGKNGTSAARNGGGLRNDQVSPTVRNCKVLVNTVVSSDGGNGCGAGIYNYLASPLIDNCTFISNYAAKGGDIFNEGPASVTITNCTFSYNSGRSIYNKGYATVTVDRCTFRNCAGGIDNYTNSLVTVRNSTFVTNIIEPGNAIRNKECWAGIFDCIFANNGPNTAAGAIYNDNAWPIISNCIFSANFCSAYGGAIENYGLGADPLIVGCKFTGNRSPNYPYSVGGAIYNATMSAGAGRIVNCLFAGNYCTGQGGAINNTGASPTISNCTFSGNLAPYGGGIFFTNGAAGTIVNCILWTNRATTSGNEIYLGMYSIPTVSYSDIAGCGGSGADWNTAFGTDGGGNIDTNPLYVASLTGTWTADGTWDPATGQTVLTNASASWTPGELAETVVTPYAGTFQYFALTNTATSITVWGDASGVGTNTAVYRINNYHLQSSAGHWGPLGWIKDAQDSACIDAGLRTAPYTLEPALNGRRINIGFDANTAQASKSNFKYGTVIVTQ